MALAYPGIILVALFWILTPLIALPVAWVRWYGAKSEYARTGWRDGLIFKGLIAATVALGAGGLLATVANVSPYLHPDTVAHKLVGAVSVVGLPAALFSIFAAIAGQGRARVSLFLVGLTTGTYWFFGFVSMFKPHWMA